MEVEDASLVSQEEDSAEEKKDVLSEPSLLVESERSVVDAADQIGEIQSPASKITEELEDVAVNQDPREQASPVQSAHSSSL